MEVGAWLGADRQRQDCRHRRCRQPADRRVRRPGAGQTGQAGAQLATAPAAANGTGVRPDPPTLAAVAQAGGRRFGEPFDRAESPVSFIERKGCAGAGTMARSAS